MFHFKILFAIIFTLISDEIFKLSHVIFVIQLISSFQENTKCESSFFADTCTRRVPIFYNLAFSEKSIVPANFVSPKFTKYFLTLKNFGDIRLMARTKVSENH
jgi:hypothetical protein